MAQPSTAITRTELSATFSEFDLAASQRGFIGPRCLRPRLVATQAADVGKIPIEALLQKAKNDARATGAGYRRGDFEFSKFNYATDEHGWEEPLDDRTLRVFGDLLDAEFIHAQRAFDFVLRNYEVAVAAALYDTNVWTGATLTTAITNEWDENHITDATPIQDIEGARRKIINGSGLVPNALICNRKQLHGLKNCDQIVNRLKYWGGDDPKSVSLAAVAACLELDIILVAGGDNLKNTAIEGQDFVAGNIWSDEYAMLARVATTDDPREPCVGRTFMWDEENAGTGSDTELALIVEEYREEQVRGSVIRARNDRDIVIMYKEAAHLLSNVITI